MRKIGWNLLFLMLTLIYAAVLVYMLLWFGAHVIGPLPFGDFLESNEKHVQIYTIAALGMSFIAASKFAAKTIVTYLHKSLGFSYEDIESLIGTATLEYSSVKREP